MGEFDEFITGKMELTVGDKPLLLDATIKDKRKIKSIYSKSGELDESKLEKLDNTFIEMLQRSYPDEKPEAMLGFYEKYDMEFLQAFFIKVGWATEDTFKELTKEAAPN